MYAGIGPAGGDYTALLARQPEYGLLDLILYSRLSLLPLEAEITSAVIFDHENNFS
jgi:hypothetical protein